MSMVLQATAWPPARSANPCAAAVSLRPSCLFLPSTPWAQCRHRPAQRSRQHPQNQQQQHQCWLRSSLRQRQALTAHGAIVPNVPFPGDDQGSTIYSALSDIEDTANSLVNKEEDPSSTSTADKQDASLNGSSPNQNGKGPVPHRWVIVGAMALAFVLCNMDKVKHCQLPSISPPKMYICMLNWLFQTE